MALQTTTRLTYDDFVKLPDDGKRYEIIDGELYVNASPVPRHQAVVGNILGEKNLQGAPSLVVEVSSDSTRRFDEVKKRKLYDKGGVDEYWIADHELELVRIYRRTAVEFELVAEISADDGGAITSPLLPGFEMDVRKVFRYKGSQ